MKNKTCRRLWPALIILLLLSGVQGDIQAEDSSWKVVSKISTQGKVFLNQAAFLNEKIGLGLNNNSLYLTSDGGKNWTKLNASSTCFLGIDIIDEKTFAVGSQCAGFYYTSDGGASFQNKRIIDAPIMLNYKNSQTIILSDTWNVLNANSQSKNAINLAYTQIKAFSCVNENLIYALSGKSQLIRSRDGGKSWEALDIKIKGLTPSFNEKSTYMRFLNEKEGLIAFYSYDEKTKGWFVLATIDGGKTWSVEDLSGLVGTAGRPFISQDGMFLTVVPVSRQEDILVLKRK